MNEKTNKDELISTICYSFFNICLGSLVSMMITKQEFGWISGISVIIFVSSGIAFLTTTTFNWAWLRRCTFCKQRVMVSERYLFKHYFSKGDPICSLHKDQHQRCVDEYIKKIVEKEQWQRTTQRTTSNSSKRGFVDHYEILGINPMASFEQVKQAYKKRCRETHPDLNGDSKKTKEEFLKVQTAFSILSNSLKKKEYDEKHDYPKQNYKTA